MKRSIYLLLLPVLIASLLLSSCMPFRRPAPQGGAPAIPKSIFRGNRQEPQLKVYMKDSGQVKTMDFEEYIMGVVAAEMEPSWPVEALAAQAILARTFTLEKITQGGVPSRNADASTDIEEFQAYDASRINNNIREAVKRTRGMVIAYNGKFVKAWFHANSGGKTATALEGLGFNRVPSPYAVSVDDPASPQAAPPDQTNWTATFTTTELKKAVQDVGQNPGTINSIEIAEKGSSGRATKLRVGSATVSAPALRLAIGSTRMRSTWIESATVQGNRVTMKGRGYGHGVGMSQWGAKGKADQGAKASDIVNFYFQGVTMHKIWE